MERERRAPSSNLIEDRKGTSRMNQRNLNHTIQSQLHNRSKRLFREIQTVQLREVTDGQFLCLRKRFWIKSEWLQVQIFNSKREWEGTGERYFFNILKRRWGNSQVLQPGSIYIKSILALLPVRAKRSLWPKQFSPIETVCKAVSKVKRLTDELYFAVFRKILADPPDFRSLDL